MSRILNHDEFRRQIDIIIAGLPGWDRGVRALRDHDQAQRDLIEELEGMLIADTNPYYEYDGPPDQDYEQAYINRKGAGFREPNL